MYRIICLDTQCILYSSELMAGGLRPCNIALGICNKAGAYHLSAEVTGADIYRKPEKLLKHSQFFCAGPWMYEQALVGRNACHSNGSDATDGASADIYLQGFCDYPYCPVGHFGMDQCRRIIGKHNITYCIQFTGYVMNRDSNLIRAFYGSVARNKKAIRITSAQGTYHNTTIDKCLKSADTQDILKYSAYVRPCTRRYECDILGAG